MIKHLPTILLIWVITSIAQTMHFYWYFEQSLANSIWWSFKDWFVWLLLITVLIKLVPNDLLNWNRENLTKLLILGFVCGWIQIIIANRIGWIVSYPNSFSRPFLDDIWHLYKKRWLQNALYFVLLWTLLTHVLTQRSFQLTQRKEKQTPQKENKFQVIDGKASYWLEYPEIHYLESAGNYLSVNTENKKSLIRNTLKSLEPSFIAKGFIKVSRSCLVNKAHIKACRRVSRSRLQIETSAGATISVGRTHWSDVKNQLNLSI